MWFQKWHEELGELSLEHSKPEKLGIDGLFLSKAYNDAKFEEKLTLVSKNEMRNLVNFNASSGKSENLHFDVLILSIAYKVSAKKVQKNDLS